jgi:signal transduction histidine kinase
LIRLRTVVSRIVALHLLAIVATSICMPLALFLMLRHAVEELHHQALRDQAAEIVRYLGTAPDGTLRLSLPLGLAEFYSKGYGRAAFAVLDEDGRVLFSSLPGSLAITHVRPAGSSIEFFQQDRVGAIAPVRPEGKPISFFQQDRDGKALYGATVAVEFAGRRVQVQVVEDVLHRDVLIDDILAEFFTRVGWITGPILVLLLIIDVVIFRRAMQPIVAASALAEEIDLAHTDLRLPEQALPREVLPLVRAVNEAFDRLDSGFRQQREFTADAAHELRTPLAILRVQIDMIDDRDLAAALRDDVESMSRLVNQLLEISELETLAIGDAETADLAAIATDAASFIAPLALREGKTVAVSGARQPVPVHGDAAMLGRAVRNLLENALAHTPPVTTVDIEVDATGALRVMDFGPGVPAAQREQIFRRFWRRDRRRPGSAGLGLAIVARIAELHRATIEVDDRPGGGAIFSLRFPAVLAAAAPAGAASQLEKAG